MIQTQQRKSLRMIYSANQRRFTHPEHPGVVFALMDRNVHFDGETRIAFVRGVRVATPGGEWERFNEEGIEYV